MISTIYPSILPILTFIEAIVAQEVERVITAQSSMENNTVHIHIHI